MPVDIAAIGIEYRTDGLEKGTRALRDNEKQANKTADAADKIGTSGKRAFGDYGNAAMSAERRIIELANSAATFNRIVTTSSAAAAFYVVQRAIVSTATALFDASANAQRLLTQLNFATGGQGARELAFVSNVANRLGLEVRSTAQAFAGFASAARGTTLEGAGARAVFESMAKASAVLGLSADQANGALLAIQQMMSKGIVSAEEFRGQLGERMPIAAEAAARGLGVTTAEFQKMLESGQIVTSDFLPKFAQAMDQMLAGSAEQAAGRLDAATARMGNSWDKLKQTIGDSGISRALAWMANAASNDMRALAEEMDRAKNAGSGFFGQTNRGLGMLIGRSTGMRNLSRDFMTLEETIADATATIKRLDEQEMRNGPPSISSMSERANAVRDLARANRELAASSGTSADPRHIDPTQTRGASMARWEAEQAKSAKDVAEFRAKISGVDKDYLPTLISLNKARQAGVVTEREYVELVSELARKNFKQDRVTGGLRGGQIDEAQRYLETLQRQLDKTRELTVEETTLAEIRSGRIGRVSAAMEKQLLSTARLIDLQRAEKDSLKASEQAATDAASAAGRLVEESMRYAQAVEEPFEKLQRQLKELESAVESNPLIEAETAARLGTKYWQEYLKSLDSVNKELNQFDDFSKRAAQNIQDSIGQGLVDLMEGNFKNIGDSFVKMINRMVAEAAAAQLSRYLFGSMVQGGSGDGAVGSLLSTAVGFLFGAPSTGAGLTTGDFARMDRLLPSANGNAFGPGGVVPFANGGIVNEPTLFKFARGTGLMGEAGPEAIMPLKRGADGKLGVSGGQQVVVNNNFTINGPITRETQQQIAARVGASAQRAVARNT